MEVIVFILEERKAEPKIVESLERCFFKNGKIILKLIFGTSIYKLSNGRSIKRYRKF